MEAVHKEMPITKALFDQFVGAFADYATANLATAVGASFAEDLAAVSAFFASDNVAKTCNQAGCPTKGAFTQRTCDDPLGTPGGTDAPTTVEGTPDTNATTTTDTDSAVVPTVAALAVAACAALQL
jgi:hypothetical protein